MSTAAMDQHVSTVIVGGGPAGVAVLSAAHEQGVLDQLLERGVLLIDPNPGGLGAGHLGDYVVGSDSNGRVFAECARAMIAAGSTPPAIADLLRRCDIDAPVPLAVAGRLLAAATRCLLDGSLPDSAYLAGRVDRVQLDAGGAVVRVSTPAGERIVTTEAVVVATGGQPSVPSWIGAAAGGARVVHSDVVVRGQLPYPSADRPGRIVIVGGSHSAFSAATVLLRRDPDHRWAPGTITIAHRRPILVTCADLATARAEGIAATARDVCPATGRVHRFGGLRGDSAALWRQIRDGAEDRVRLASLPAGDDGRRASVAGAELVVAATGYASTARRILREVPQLRPDSLSPFDGRGRLCDRGGAQVPHVFGIGLGTAHRRDATTGGEPSYEGAIDGASFYRLNVGPSILSSLLATPPPRSAR